MDFTFNSFVVPNPPPAQALRNSLKWSNCVHGLYTQSLKTFIKQIMYSCNRIAWWVTLFCYSFLFVCSLLLDKWHYNVRFSLLGFICNIIRLVIFNVNVLKQSNVCIKLTNQNHENRERTDSRKWSPRIWKQLCPIGLNHFFLFSLTEFISKLHHSKQLCFFKSVVKP